MYLFNKSENLIHRLLFWCSISMPSSFSHAFSLSLPPFLLQCSIFHVQMLVATFVSKSPRSNNIDEYPTYILFWNSNLARENWFDHIYMSIFDCTHCRRWRRRQRQLGVEHWCERSNLNSNSNQYTGYKSFIAPPHSLAFTAFINSCIRSFSRALDGSLTFTITDYIILL